MEQVVFSNDPFEFAKGGGKKIVNFTITNGCNAKCIYCSFHLNKRPVIVRFPKAKRAIDFMVKNDVGVLSLTGGEPFLNPDLARIARYAKRKGLIVYTGTNGTLLDEKRLKALKDSGLDALWISYESTDDTVFEKNRGVPGLAKRIRAGLRTCKRLGLNIFCISLINKSILSLNDHAAKLLDLGFTKVKFDYPMDFPLRSTYLGWSDSPLLKFSGDEMEHMIKQILKLKRSKKKGAIKVINPIQGLTGAIEHFHGRRPAFKCTAGEKVLYLDTDLRFFRCPALPDVIGEVGGRLDCNTIDCEKCYYQGVRDYDAFYYLLSRFDRGLGHAFSGRLGSALRLLEPKVRLALADAWDIRNSGLV
jgi:MoaA/NifB/PqqE/SkfB family radical SAM enzyme